MRGAVAVAAVVATVAAAPRLRAQSPLERPVSLRVHDVALRTALDRLAAAARVRLSYSAETLPLDRSVTVDADGAPLGAALADVLRGTAVEPVVVGAEQVVLAPSRRAVAAVPNARPDATPNATPAAHVAVLDQVVVTGSAAGASERALPFALSVVRVGASDGVASLAGSIDGAVPGLWAWAQQPTSLLARYGSIRGASSFGLTAPKVFVDGIEAANPLLVTTLAPESIDRVEVIRGPQGAAFYGADAISGVINIVTRHDGAADGTRQIDVRGGIGAAGSAYAEHPAFTQDHGAALRAGSATRSAGLSVAATTIGAYVPGAAARRVLADAYGKHVGARWSLAGTAYLDGEDANTVRSPLIVAALPSANRPGQAPIAANAPTLPEQSVWQYTLGGTATRAAGERWTHVVTFGANGYRLRGLAVDPVAVPSAVDSALLAARGAADRTTVRASSVARFGDARDVATSLTLAGDWAALRDATASSASSSTTTSAVWLQTTGLSAQATTSFQDAVFLTAGLRGERNDGYAEASRYAALPMFGASIVRSRGDATLKLRTAYGRGLRPARTETRITSWRGAGVNARVPDLAPEEQSGLEGGVDLFLRRRALGGLLARGTLELHATAFDQRASGLIQQVAVIAPGVDSASHSGPGGGNAGPGGQRRVEYALQNVGVIANHGIELEAAWRSGPFAVNGTFTGVDSRVRHLARGYTGDLRPGDRMLEVPARTAGLDASWSAPRWSASIGATRAFDWTNYDRVALAQAYASTSRQTRELVGPQLRTFWRTYPGVTHLRASGAHEVGRGVALTFSGENLLDRQRGEPDNATVLPGRTLSLGARARF